MNLNLKFRSKPRTIHLKRNGAIVWGSPLSAAQGHKHRRTREPTEAEIKRLVPVNHVVACLHVHYLETRKEDIVALITADASISARQKQQLTRDLKDTQSTVKVRQDALENKYVLDFFDSLEPTVRMYDTLVMAGEKYGSVIGRNHRSSYVAVAFPDEKGDDVVLWYGQVSYYISHQYRGVAHFFAVCRWYLWPGQTKASGIHAQTAMNKFYSGIHPSARCKESFDAFPVLTMEFNPSDTQDVVPVQCISHRWIPGKIPDKHQAASAAGATHCRGKGKKSKHATLSNLQLAYPVPTRVHA